VLVILVLVVIPRISREAPPRLVLAALLPFTGVR
jgi:hypothetical protein